MFQIQYLLFLLHIPCCCMFILSLCTSQQFLILFLITCEDTAYLLISLHTYSLVLIFILTSIHILSSKCAMCAENTDLNTEHYFHSSAAGEDVFVTHSLEEAMKLLSTPPLSDRVETLWNLGGSYIYKVRTSLRVAVSWCMVIYRRSCTGVSGWRGASLNASRVLVFGEGFARVEWKPIIFVSSNLQISSCLLEEVQLLISKTIAKAGVVIKFVRPRSATK